jgi:predicted ATPase
MPMTKIELTNFTVFESLVVDLAPGINVFVGENGTGKTHLLKAAYAALKADAETPRNPHEREDELKKQRPDDHILRQTFLPFQGDLGRLIHRSGSGASISVQIPLFKPGGRSTQVVLQVSKSSGSALWASLWPQPATYIPVKEFLSHSPGFRSSYARRELHFDRTFDDILIAAQLPRLRETTSALVPFRQRLEDALNGTVELRDETFFLVARDGTALEFDLLAEGLRKLGLMLVLLQNGELESGHVLFWDEPETNLNPKLMKVVAEVLVGLARNGLQVLLATHDYAFLKELELASQPSDGIRYNALYKDDTGKVLIKWSDAPFRVEHNPVAEAVGDLYERELAHLISKQGGAQ